ncbi:MAG TPA: DUF2007 domain-containing protein [Bacteroidales bacterium]|nr:MAG: hypothetical protein BWY22_00942 [Bacteroidetes bacterium ADurb.Bin217]HOS84212.1 DUF2007 domain-containing protein [Bacteroidales bacterium]HPM13614.1 DUF2007 domain-containing protein [Bacteroidales bacterium]
MNWITIHTYTYSHEAYIAQTKLESCGIKTFLQDELTTQIIPVYSYAMGGVKLQVQEQDVEKAIEILNEGL